MAHSLSDFSHYREESVSVSPFPTWGFRCQVLKKVLLKSVLLNLCEVADNPPAPILRHMGRKYGTIFFKLKKFLNRNSPQEIFSYLSLSGNFYILFVAEKSLDYRILFLIFLWKYAPWSGTPLWNFISIRMRSLSRNFRFNVLLYQLEHSYTNRLKEIVYYMRAKTIPDSSYFLHSI